MSAKDAALQLRSALQEFIEKNPTPENLNKIIIVVYDRTLSEDFKDTLTITKAKKTFQRTNGKKKSTIALSVIFRAVERTRYIDLLHRLLDDLKWI